VREKSVSIKVIKYDAVILFCYRGVKKQYYFLSGHSQNALAFFEEKLQFSYFIFVSAAFCLFVSWCSAYRAPAYFSFLCIACLSDCTCLSGAYKQMSSILADQ
jgi:hypothetical protein